ncbi:MAG: hypothetical protein ACP5O1_11110 [Phycisphaerae bacterium]
MVAVTLVILMVFSAVPTQHANGPSPVSATGASAVPSSSAPVTSTMNDSGHPPAASRAASHATVFNNSFANSQQAGTTPAFFSSGSGLSGLSIGAENTMTGMRYPMVYPYDSAALNGTAPVFTPQMVYQNVSNAVPVYAYQGNSQYDALFATSLHWVANFTRIYPPSVDYSTGYAGASGGLGPNYSLQFNVPFFSSVPGGESVSWYQSAFEFITVLGTGNPQDSNASYFLLPNSQWWLNYSRRYIVSYSYNYSNYNNLFVNPEHPLLFSSWLNISFVPGASMTSGSVFITEDDRVTGLLSKGYWNPVPYSDHSYRTVWFNTTFQIINGSKEGVDPFPVFFTGYGYTFDGSPIGTAGLAFGGVGNAQFVWGNFTATFGVAEDVQGTLLPVSGVAAFQSSTGETSEGDEGVTVLGSPTNPSGLPAYFPYVYDSNQSGGPLGDSQYNANHMSAGSSLIVGSVFPSNASITAYSVYTHSYVPVVKNGSSFYVDFPGLYGMNSSSIFIGQLSLDYWSPILLNFSLPGFQGTSTTVSPYFERTPFVEVRSVVTVLAPIDQKMVYGFISFPMSYFAYFADSYVFSHFSGIGNLNGSYYSPDPSSASEAWQLLADIWEISANVSSYFWLNVTTGSHYYNESHYLPYVIRPLLETMWGSEWTPFYYSAFSFFVKLFFNGPIEVPYYVLAAPSTPSASVSAPLLSGNVPLPSGSGAFEENISLSSLDFPLTVRFPSVPGTYGSAPPSISSVSVNGVTVWSGNSTYANVTLEVPLGVVAASNVSAFLDDVYARTYYPGSLSSYLPSFYYNATFTISPSSDVYAPVTISRNMMVFNYSLYALELRTGTDAANVSQTFPVEFPRVQVGVGGGYYTDVQGYVYGIYNLTGQRFVLGGANIQFVRNNIVIGTATTSANGYYNFNFTLGPASAWGYNKTVEVTVLAMDAQFRNFSGILYLHADSVEWFNATEVFISTMIVFGWNVTIPYWFLQAAGGALLTFADGGLYIVLLYYGMIAGLGAAAVAVFLAVRKMLKARPIKVAESDKGAQGQVKQKK